MGDTKSLDYEACRTWGTFGLWVHLKDYVGIVLSKSHAWVEGSNSKLTGRQGPKLTEALNSVMLKEL